MALNKGKHIVEEIDNIRCSVVEINTNETRCNFLKSILEHNGYTVKTSKDENNSYKIGVTDLLFNPVIDIYKRRLLSFTGKKVTPAYWLQLSENETETEINYWLR